MLAEEKNIKDLELNSAKDIKDTFSVSTQLDIPIQELTMSYRKTNKLITALYMVTDIIDKEEPIRNKLRTLGSGIISDIHSSPANACNKIYEIMSFLEIAFAINIISEMNCNILRKEFSELNQSIKESTDKIETINRQINLSDFFTAETSSHLFEVQDGSDNKYKSIGQSSIGHKYSTRIGVQKGSTLMKALSDKTRFLSDKIPPRNFLLETDRNHFDLLKSQRRKGILNIIKIISGSATIKNIKDKIKEVPEQAGSLVSCSEKTLQRELMSMTKDGVLKKTGEKRWSRYELVDMQG